MSTSHSHEPPADEPSLLDLLAAPGPRSPAPDSARSERLSIAELEVLREIYQEPVPRPAERSAERLGEAADANGAGEALRRAVNVLIAAVALVLLAPLMTLIALAVRLSSRGPVIYVQERVGLDRRRGRGPGAGNAPLGVERRAEDAGGRPYRMFKFRTMRVDAEAHGRPVWATRDDPRVTRVGRALRRSRLDELPQLVNVLRGEMNIVGPRPERPTIAARLGREVNGYALRYQVRPGITGLAQISHPYDSSIEDVRAKVRYDLEYLSRRSVREDLRILVRTVPVMLGRRTGW